MSCWDCFNICKLLEIEQPAAPSGESGDEYKLSNSQYSDSSKLSKPSRKSQELSTKIHPHNERSNSSALLESKMERAPCLDHPFTYPSEMQSPQPGPSRLMYEPESRTPNEVGFSKILVHLKENVENTIENYKLFMKEVLQSHKTLTNTQLKKLHEKHKSNLLSSFCHDYQNHPTLANMVKKHCLQLSTDLDSQYHFFLKQHQEHLKRVGLKNLQAEAENFYDTDMENYRPWEKSRPQIKSKHLDVLRGALEHFENLVRLEQGLMIGDQDRGIFRCSLKRKLDSKLEEILKTCVTFNIGIYIGDEEVTVGTVDIDNAKEIEIISRAPAGILFSQDGIQVTESNRHWNYFSVRELIKTPKSCLTIDLKTHKFVLSPEEILAVFFEKLLSQNTTHYPSIIDNAVITIGFPCTSSEKKRVKTAARLSSMPQTQILPTVVTTAVAYAVDHDYYCDEQPMESKFIFSAHCQNESFSMAIVEVSQDCIATAACIGSRNFKECQQMNFISAHSQIFTQEDPDREVIASVSKIYAAAAQYIQNHGPTHKKIDSYISIKDSSHVNKLDEILSKALDYCPSIQSKWNFEGPLAGACFLASKRLPSSLLPADLQVYGASCSNLIVSVENMKKRIDFRNRVYIPELPTFQIFCRVPEKGSTIIVTEEFASGHEFQAGRWKILANIPTSIKVPTVTIRGMVDPDGILSIDAAFPPEIEGGKVLRLKPDESISDMKKLQNFYEASTSRLKNNPCIEHSAPCSSTSAEVESSIPQVKSLNILQERNQPDLAAYSKQIEDSLKKVVDESVSHYKLLMTEITDRGDPLTDSQVKLHHQQILDSVVEALRLTYSHLPLYDMSTLITKTETTINSQLHISLLRHATKVENALAIEKRILESTATNEPFDEFKVAYHKTYNSTSETCKNDLY